MCSSKEELLPSHPRNLSEQKRRPRRAKVRVHRLARRKREEKLEKDMELKNWKLYFENQTIIEENEKLRKKADLLHQENLVLMSELQKRFPHLHHYTQVGFQGISNPT